MAANSILVDLGKSAASRAMTVSVLGAAAESESYTVIDRGSSIRSGCTSQVPQGMPNSMA